MKTIVQTILSQLKTFQPSKMPKGIRLKTAIHALKAAPKRATLINGPGKSGDSANKMTERERLVTGPATAVFPTVSLFAYPAIITAPGEIILKNGEKIDMRVIKAPNVVNRNSAQRP